MRAGGEVDRDPGLEGAHPLPVVHQELAVEVGAVAGSFAGAFEREEITAGWDRSVVFVPNGKSYKSKRYVPLSDRMRAILRLREIGKSPWVFPSKRDRCEHLTTIAKQWTATVEAVNLAAAEKKSAPISAALKLYCARHTFGSDMLGQGLNIVEVSKIPGHEDLEITMKYLHPDTSKAAATVNKRN